MKGFKGFIAMVLSSSVILATLLIFCIYKSCHPEKKWHVAPDIEMLQNCESMMTTVHLFNPDTVAMAVKYDVFADLNDNAMLDTSDRFLYGEPRRILGPQAEFQGITIGQKRFKGYSFIVRATTDNVIAYYASIPCDTNRAERDSTPTK